MRTRNEINNTEWFGHMPDGWEMKPLKSLFFHWKRNHGYKGRFD